MSYYGTHKKAAMNEGASAAVTLAILANYSGWTGVLIWDLLIGLGIAIWLVVKTRNAIGHGISAASR
jgi:hypothetical protein